MGRPGRPKMSAAEKAAHKKAYDDNYYQTVRKPRKAGEAVQPRKKLTEEERKQHKREASKRYYEKVKKAKQVTKEEWNRFLAMNPDLYPNKPPQLDREQKTLIHNLLSLPLSPEPKMRPKSIEIDEAKKQLGFARNLIKHPPISEIKFNLAALRPEGKDYLLKHLPEVIEELLTTIGLDDKWSIYYAYNGTWKQRTLDSITQQYLRNQIGREINEHSADIINNEQINSGNSFFPVSINTLQEIHIINEDENGLHKKALRGKLTAKNFKTEAQFKEYQKLIKNKVSEKTGNASDAAYARKLDRFLKVNLIRKKRTGKFWKWLNKLPEINLEKYMIFNELNKRTAAQAERDNCFIYACRMAGVSNDIINNMRYSIHKRSFGITDIKRISDETGLAFEIRLGDTDRDKEIIKPKGKEVKDTIKLLLLRDHYMVNEKMPISPYYIRHREEINNHPSAGKWSIEDRMMITKQNGKAPALTSSRNNCAVKYYKKEKRMHSIRKILLAMLETDAFEPINSNMFMVFNSLICYENIDPITSLEYDPSFCVRKKCAPNW